MILDCFVASLLAMTTERVSRSYPHFKQRIQDGLLATLIRPSDLSSWPSEVEEGAGNAGRWPQPMARLQQRKQAAVTTGPADIRHSLRDGLRLIRDLPGAPGFLATIIRAKRSFIANLTSASGCQDHTISSSAGAALVLRNPPRPPLPRLTYRDDAYVPLHRGGMATSDHNFWKNEI
jgi:hypothetical protein